MCVALAYGETASRMSVLMARGVHHPLPFSETGGSKMVMRSPSTPMRNVTIRVELSGPAPLHTVS